MGRVSVKGVVVGGVLDIILSMILGIPLVICALATAKLAGTPPDQLGRALAASIHARPLLYGTQLLIGVVTTVFGGYVAAWIAKHDEILNGLLSALVCVAVGVISLVSGIQHETVVMQVVLFALTFASGALGGYLRSRKTRARAVPTPP
jgi:putative membrane protein (TIGR04086 family)